MKIAVPAEGNTMESVVCQSFGRTYYFIVVDSETLEYKVIDNQAVSSEGGAGIKAAQAVVDSGADAVVTFHCGQNAADVLKAADIKILKAVPGKISEMIQKYKAGELSELTQIHPGHHQHGG
jgi:predicted Fe-Mo cluster-binding NifX family protein